MHPMPRSRIVIIDDEKDVLFLLEYNLKKSGFSVASFSDPIAALDHILKRKPDMILCDWMMPQMDGITLCREIKSSVKTSDIPFVMVTCKSANSERKEAIGAGVTDYICKPIQIPALIRQLKQILDDRPLKSA
jgi:DNA-binding response OmpR family regulator